MSPMFLGALLSSNASLVRSVNLHAVFGPIALLGLVAVVAVLVVMVLLLAGERPAVVRDAHLAGGERRPSALPAPPPVHASRERAA